MYATMKLDRSSKRQALAAEMEWARAELLLETLETRKLDSLDVHEISVDAVRDLVRHAFERGYSEGLNTGYRQGRGDAAFEAGGGQAFSRPRNPNLAAD